MLENKKKNYFVANEILNFIKINHKEELDEK